MKVISIEDIDTIANALNIEGGYPEKILNSKKQKIWGNYVVVLDRPLIDNIVFDEILQLFKNNKYPLLENAIEELNENNFLVLFLSTLCYYIKNAVTLTTITDRKINIKIHFHQDKTCLSLIKIFNDFLIEISSELHLDLNNVNINYVTDQKTYQFMYPDLYFDFTNTIDDKFSIIDCYDDTDILLSFSQCAGLTESINAGDILIPSLFIPFEINTGMIYPSKSYTTENHFNETCFKILESEIFTFICKKINDNYVSSNSKKIFKCDKKNLQTSIINNCSILQADGLWNPIDKSEEFLIV